MAKDDKGKGDEKEKKAALKGVQSMQDDIAGLRDLHAQLGKQIEAYDKNADALATALEKDNEKEQQKRWEMQQKLQVDIFATQQEITKNKMKASDKAARAVADYIKS